MKNQLHLKEMEREELNQKIDDLAKHLDDVIGRASGTVITVKSATILTTCMQLKALLQIKEPY